MVFMRDSAERVHMGGDLRVGSEAALPLLRGLHILLFQWFASVHTCTGEPRVGPSVAFTR